MSKLAAPLNALGAAVPLTLGSSVLLYGMVAPGYLGAGVLAGLLGLVVVHLLAAPSLRPVYYAARFFEAATLGTMVVKLGQMLESAGHANTAEARLMLLISIMVLAALVVGLLWAMKAQRFARFVPAPVYVGFVNTITVAVLITQTQSLAQQSSTSTAYWMPLTVALLTLALALAVRRWRPSWPASSVGLAGGLGLAWALDPTRDALPRITEWGVWTLPMLHADTTVWVGTTAVWYAVGGWVVVNALIIGLLVFLNTVSTGQMLAQTDERETVRPADGWRESVGLVMSGALGSAPLSGAPTASLAASHFGPVERRHLVAMAALTLAVVGSQALVWLPVAAISGVMLFDAWVLLNQESVRRAWRWIRRLPLASHAKEDLILIGSVMAASLLLNMVAGLMTGLLLGLLLHAHRSTRQPVRNVWNGQQIASNCARSRAELALLSEHGQDLRVFQLDAQQFFASAALLNRTVREKSEGAFYVIMDWSRVDHVDSSVTQVVARLDTYLKHRGCLVWHAGTENNGPEVHDALGQSLQNPQWSPDLDRALERAENLLLQHYNPTLASTFEESTPTTWIDLLPKHLKRELEGRVTIGQFSPGEVILREGDESDCLWVILRGRASVYLRHGQPHEMRIAGISPGTTVGEMGFLDGSRRSATVVAESTVRALRLSRADYDELAVEHPAIVQHLLTFLTTDISARLRFANQKKLIQ